MKNEESRSPVTHTTYLEFGDPRTGDRLKKIEGVKIIKFLSTDEIEKNINSKKIFKITFYNDLFLFHCYNKNSSCYCFGLEMEECPFAFFCSSSMKVEAHDIPEYKEFSSPRKNLLKRKEHFDKLASEQLKLYPCIAQNKNNNYLVFHELSKILDTILKLDFK